MISPKHFNRRLDEANGNRMTLGDPHEGEKKDWMYVKLYNTYKVFYSTQPGYEVQIDRIVLNETNVTPDIELMGAMDLFMEKLKEYGIE